MPQPQVEVMSTFEDIINCKSALQKKFHLASVLNEIKTKHQKIFKNFLCASDEVKITYNVCDNFEEVQRLVNQSMPVTIPITIKASNIKGHQLKDFVFKFRQEQ